MSETFGSRLKQFALSVDIVDDNIFRQTWELIRQYLTEQLEVTYMALLVESRVNKKRGLSARECSHGSNLSFSLKTDKGDYTGLAAYSFAKKKPLWLVSPDKEPLDQNSSIQDQWSKAKNLPPFDRQSDAGIRSVAFV